MADRSEAAAQDSEIQLCLLSWAVNTGLLFLPFLLCFGGIILDTFALSAASHSGFGAPGAVWVWHRAVEDLPGLHWVTAAHVHGLSWLFTFTAAQGLEWSSGDRVLLFSPSPCALQLRAAVAGCSAVLSLPLLASAAAQGTAPLELPFGQPVNTWAVGRSSGSCEQLGCIPGRLWVKQWV